MIADIYTIAWKEWKEMLHAGGNVRSGLVRLLFLPAVLGIFLPLQTGRAWVMDPRTLAGYAWLPALLAIGLAPDSFAGERERRTLETLLASRLPDRSILLGKIVATVGYAWGTSLLMLVLGPVTVSLAHGRGRLLFYQPSVSLAAIGVSLLLAVSATGAGVLVSLRAATVRHAQQTLSVGLIGAMVLVYAPFLLVPRLPAPWRACLERLLAGSSPAHLAAAAALALVMLAGGLLLAAAARFRRARLILDG